MFVGLESCGGSSYIKKGFADFGQIQQQTPQNHFFKNFFVSGSIKILMIFYFLPYSSIFEKIIFVNSAELKPNPQKYY